MDGKCVLFIPVQGYQSVLLTNTDCGFLNRLKNKSTSFTIALGRLEVADYLGTDRSALTRELNNMKKAALIDFEKNTFTLLESFYE